MERSDHQNHRIVKIDLINLRIVYMETKQGAGYPDYKFAWLISSEESKGGRNIPRPNNLVPRPFPFKFHENKHQTPHYFFSRKNIKIQNYFSLQNAFFFSQDIATLKQWSLEFIAHKNKQFPSSFRKLNSTSWSLMVSSFSQSKASTVTFA